MIHSKQPIVKALAPLRKRFLQSAFGMLFGPPAKHDLMRGPDKWRFAQWYMGMCLWLLKQPKLPFGKWEPLRYGDTDRFFLWVREPTADDHTQQWGEHNLEAVIEFGFTHSIESMDQKWFIRVAKSTAPSRAMKARQPSGAGRAAAAETEAGQVAAGEVAAGEAAEGQAAVGEESAGQEAATQAGAGQLAEGQGQEPVRRPAAGQDAAGLGCNGQAYDPDMLRPKDRAHADAMWEKGMKKQQRAEKKTVSADRTMPQHEPQGVDNEGSSLPEWLPGITAHFTEPGRVQGLGT